jgi:BlaI family penicillinase repressor
MKIKATESELEILQVLWRNGTATVRDVHEELSKYKDAGYTTTLKLMQIMHEKGLVERDTTSRTHVYKPLVSQQKAQRSAIDKMVNTMFEGSTAGMVIQALGNHKASDDEIAAIKKYLQQFENDNK